MEDIKEERGADGCRGGRKRSFLKETSVWFPGECSQEAHLEKWMRQTTIKVVEEVEVEVRLGTGGSRSGG